MLGLKNRESLDSTVSDEFENMVSQFRALFLTEHNEDGTHRASPEVTNFVPPGSVMPYAGTTAPSNWFICDGAQVNRVTYKRLFDIIGTTYGAGDGSTTYNLPDLRGRFPLGKSAAGTGAVLGSTGGLIDHIHTGPAHTHTIASGGGHTHTGGAHTHDAGTLAGPSHTHAAGTLAGPSHSHGAGTLAGPSHTHTVPTTGVPSATNGVASNAHTHPESGGGTTGVENEAGALVASNAHTHAIANTGAEGTGAVTGSTGSAGTGSVTGSTAAEGTGSVTGATASGGAVATSSDGAHDHGGITGSDGSGNTGTANPPFISLNYIIKD